MKNLQKGFIAPVILVIIALLVIGGGIYVYENKKTETPVATTPTPPVTIPENNPNNTLVTKPAITTPVTKPPTTPTKSDLTVSPSSGSSPLTVNFSLLIKKVGEYTVNFGDNEKSITTPATGCNQNSTAVAAGNCYLNGSHTYSLPGTYSLGATYFLETACPSNVTTHKCGSILNAPGNPNALVIVNSTAGSSQSISISNMPQSVARGNKVTILWSSQNAPDNSAVVLSLYDVNGRRIGVIAQDLKITDSYTWTVPTCTSTQTGNTYSSCIPTDSNGVYETPPGTYKVIAKLYTPKGGYGGGMIAPSSQLQTVAVSSGASLTIK